VIRASGELQPRYGDVILLGTKLVLSRLSPRHIQYFMVSNGIEEGNID
jgi:hypothetical protein